MESDSNFIARQWMDTAQEGSSVEGCQRRFVSQRSTNFGEVSVQPTCASRSPIENVYPPVEV
ncbi:hypothetical protein TRAPUB_3614 [Trametes pubescens]|uniref:Uncharacterized protein n=1 Tax=Trametes pubescens TaxID=154538 RepID=A0A1M2VDB5_TRAPU|nr:hypothetical protein TRAPUB_3614 [Trametes pubescens]